MIGLLDGLKIGAGAVLGAVLIAGPAYFYGHARGAVSAHTDALEKTVEIFQERELTNAEISRADAAHLCAHIGLQDGDRDECVRRLAEADTDAGERGEDYHGR